MKDVDSAILKALGLTEKETTIRSHGGSGFSQTLKLTANKDGEEKEYFVKIGGSDSKAMFAGSSCAGICVLQQSRTPANIKQVSMPH